MGENIYKCFIQIYKKFIPVNIKKRNLLKNGQRIWIDIFQRRHTDDQQAHEMFSILIIREMQIQTTEISPHMAEELLSKRQ